MGKRHYEIMFILRPLMEERLDGIIENYRGMITRDGDIHRFENCGLRQFAYAIKDVRRGYYILMNVQCPVATVEEMEKAFRFDENVLRFLLIKRTQGISDPSPLLNSQSEQRTSRRETAAAHTDKEKAEKRTPEKEKHPAAKSESAVEESEQTETPASDPGEEPTQMAASGQAEKTQQEEIQDSEQTENSEQIETQEEMEQQETAEGEKQEEEDNK